MTGRGPSKGGGKEARYGRSGSTGPDRRHRPEGLAACGSVSAGSAGHPPRPARAHPRRRRPPRNAGRRVALRGRRSADRSWSAGPRLARGHAQGRDPGTGRGRRAGARFRRAGRQHCTAAPAGSVRLVFAAGPRSFPPVTVHESGCRSVTGWGRPGHGPGLRSSACCSTRRWAAWAGWCLAPTEQRAVRVVTGLK